MKRVSLSKIFLIKLNLFYFISLGKKEETVDMWNPIDCAKIEDALKKEIEMFVPFEVYV